MIAYSFFADFYDVLMQKTNYSDVCKFICNTLSKYNIKKESLVLDAACGTGTLTYLLSDCGYDMIGVDISAEMLSKAKEKSSQTQPLFLCQDLCKLDLFGTVSACICSFDGMNHLPDTESVKQTVAKMSLFTEPDGLLIFDINTVYKNREVLGDNSFVFESDEPCLMCVWRNCYLPDKHRVDILLDFFVSEENGDEEDSYIRYSEDFSEIDIEIDAMKQILYDCGYTVEGIYDGYTENPLTKKSQRAVFVCKKEK